MKRIAALAAVTIALTTATTGWLPASAGSEPSAVGPAGGGLEADPVKTGLENPAGFTFLPDGRIVYGERRTGRVMLLNPKNGNQSVIHRISKIQSAGERGLLGLAVDPKWPNKPFVYAYATRDVGPVQNQIMRIKVDEGKSVSRKIIWRLDTAAGVYHDGGHIDFGPDQKLYAVVGEGHDESNAQDLTNDAGKVLRMNRNGSAPGNNPFEDSLIFSFGLRNSFGFAFDPQSGTLWETENGPGCVDEINVIKKGGNYAWGPNQTCAGAEPENTNQDGPQPRIMPLRWFTPTTAPTGLAFCEGCGIPDSDGALFFGDYNNGDIYEIELTGNREGVDSMSVAFQSSSSVLSMQAAPDGGVYFSSSDAIYRLVQG